MPRKRPPFLRGPHALLGLGLLLTILVAADEPGEESLTFAGRFFRQALAAREAGDRQGARELLFAVLEREDRHLPTLALLGTLAEEDDDLDRALYHYGRYIDIVGRLARLRGGEKAERERILERIATLDPQPRKLDRAVYGHVKHLKSLARKYLRRQFYGSALRAFTQIQALDPRNEEARDAIAQIRRQGGAEVAVEDFRGGSDPLSDYSREWIAEQDAEHQDWATAYRKKTANYTIVCDAGFEVLETVALVMEQMNEFYREVFRHAQDGEPTPQIEVWVFRDRAEFMQVAKPSKSWMGGYYDGSKVAVYDNVGSGKSRRELYVILFHEAAHQFVHLAGGPVPKWMNEGLASYFEGARILSNKQVVKNLVATGRLFPLHESLVGPEDQRIALQSLLEITAESGSYGPPHYPYGWGLVYFLLNYETEDGKLAYREHFDDYFKSFRPPTPSANEKRRRKRKGADDEGDQTKEEKPPALVEYERLQKLSPVQRFVEFFVRRPGLPHIKNLGKLERVWKDYIHELFLLETGDREHAEKLLARARDRIAAGNSTSAVTHLERLIGAYPQRPDALHLLAQEEEELGRQDRALNTYRDLLVQTSATPELEQKWREERENARQRIVKLDPLRGLWEKLDQKLALDLRELSDGYREAQMPTMAQHTLEKLRHVRRHELLAERLLAELEQSTGTTTRRWRLLFNEYDLEGWYGGTEGKNYSVQDGILHGRVTEEDRDQGLSPNAIVYRLLFVDYELEGDYEFEAEMLSMRDEKTSRHCKLMGLAFGAKTTEDFWALNFLPFGTLDLGTFFQSWDTDRLLTRIYREGEWIKLRIAVVGDQVTAYLDGEERFRKTLPPGAVRGDFGLLTGDGHAAFRNLRIYARW